MLWLPVACAALLSMLGYTIFQSEAVGFGAAVAGFVAGLVLKSYIEERRQRRGERSGLRSDR
ncbi:MAG: hypothetical protein ACTS10_11360 [Kiloniellales bacterium]